MYHIKKASIIFFGFFLLGCSSGSQSRYKYPQSYRQKNQGPQTKAECLKLYPKAPEWWKSTKCSFYDNRRISGPAKRYIIK